MAVAQQYAEQGFYFSIQALTEQQALHDAKRMQAIFQSADVSKLRTMFFINKQI